MLHEVSMEEDVARPRHHACVERHGGQVPAHREQEGARQVLLLKLCCNKELFRGSIKVDIIAETGKTKKGISSRKAKYSKFMSPRMGGHDHLATSFPLFPSPPPPQIGELF